MTTRSNEAYEFVRKRLLSGKYPPGTRLGEMEMAADAGLSPTPVREAFRRLASEGLLEHRPRRGVVVRNIGNNEIESLYELRELLEPFAARRAATRINRVELKNLEDFLSIQQNICKNIKNTKDKLQGDDTTDWLEADRRFHETILAAAGNQFLLRMLDTCRVIAILLSRPLHHLTVEQMRTTIKQHENILGTMRRHDSDAAERYARKHIEFSFNTIVDSMKENMSKRSC